MLPEVHLSSLPRLKRVELTGWQPSEADFFSLPPHCELCVTVASKTLFEEEDWEAMQGHLTVLSLSYIGHQSLQAWPEGFERLSRLQYFMFECRRSLNLDLAELKAIPHVDLYIGGRASLTLTDGAWQSLEVHGRRGLCINFADVDAFVRGTRRFSLTSSGGDILFSQPMCSSVREACSRQSKSCYQCGFVSEFRWRPYTVRVSNCKKMMQLEPSWDGELAPSGGLHDGYAGTHEDSPLWRDLLVRFLACKEHFWPSWAPHAWVFGK